jgi:hypothetical protein
MPTAQDSAPGLMATRVLDHLFPWETLGEVEPGYRLPNAVIAAMKRYACSQMWGTSFSAM